MKKSILIFISTIFINQPVAQNSQDEQDVRDYDINPIIYNYHLNNISINRDDYAYEIESEFNIENTFARGSAYGDLDGDGLNELVIGSRNNIEIRKYDNGDYNSVWQYEIPSTNFTASVAIGDITGDGNNEIVVAGSNDPMSDHELRLFKYNSDSTDYALIDSTTMSDNLGTGNSLQVVDIDNDGNNEVIVGLYSGGIRIYEYDSEWVLENSLSGVGSRCEVESIDLDGDDDEEIIIAYYVSGSENRIAIYKYNDSSFVLQYDEQFGTYQNAIETGDIDNDGTNEIIIGRDDAGISIISFNGDTYTQEATIAHGTRTYALAVGDIDNDGLNEFTAGGFGVNGTYVYKSYEPDTYDSVLTIQNSGIFTGDLIGDFDNDGLNEFYKTTCASCDTAQIFFIYGDSPIATTYVPDDNFEQALIDLGYDNVLDNYVVTDSINSVTFLDVRNDSISDLTGIEAFTALDTLWCGINQLDSLDVSSNTALTSLSCGLNQLTSLTVGSNTALIYLDCHLNQLTSLDVSGATSLITLSCRHNDLTELDVSSNTALTLLNGYGNQLTSLDLSNNTALTYLTCNNNQLTYLNMKNGVSEELTTFNATNNSLVCIEVNAEDVDYAAETWTSDRGNIDEGVIFSESCTAVISVSPSALDEQLIEGDSSTQVLTISNGGSIDLDWEISLEGTGLCNYGNDEEFPNASSHGADFLLGNLIICENDGYIEYLNVIGKVSGPEFQLAIYSDDGTRDAANLIVATDIYVLDVGVNQLPVESTYLPAGEYWIMGIYESQASIGIDEYINPTEIQYISHDFGSPLPTSLTGLDSYEGRNMNYYMSVTCAGSDDRVSDRERGPFSFQDVTYTYEPMNHARDEEWLSTNPTTGTILAGESEDITVTFNATTMDTGSYSTTISISSNDMVDPIINVPVSLDVRTLSMYYVTPTGSDSTGDGTYENPFATIQKGIDAASSGDTVSVAAGTYVENLFWETKNISVIGMDGSESTIIDGSGLDNVFRIRNVNNSSTLQGFTIQNGSTQSSSGHPWFFGGGVVISWASLTVRDVIIQDNESHNNTRGHALFVENSSSLFDNVIVKNNNKGGIRLNASGAYPEFTGVTISGNTGGYGLEVYDTGVQMDNSIIENNDYGGLWYEGVGFNSSLITNTLFASNGSSTSVAGGLHVVNSGQDLIVDNCTFYNNSRTQSLGADIYSQGNYWNNSDYEGNNITVSNSIFVNESINASSSIYAVENSNVDSLYLYYNLFSFNEPFAENDETNYYMLQSNIFNSNPLFCNPDSGDYTLSETSPCVGSGQDGQDLGVFGVGCESLDIEWPTIVNIWDVPDDQGGWVYIQFNPSAHDASDEGPLGSYTIERLDDEEWVSLHSIDAYGSEYYLTEAHTLRDSTEEDDGMTTYRVVAAMVVGALISETAEGYSIDNIAPGVPTGLMATVSETGIHLSWDLSSAEDFQYFDLEKSSTADFGEYQVIETADTAYLDMDYEVNVTVYYRLVAYDDAGNASEHSVALDITVLWADLGIAIPDEFAIHQNYPNPFNPVTTLRYDIPENSHVTIIIYDMLGRHIKTVINQTQDAGYRSVIWNATNDYGKPVSAGIYLYQIQAGEYISTKKMVLLK